MEQAKRPVAFWMITGFLVVSVILLLMGQTMALIDYDLAVQLGLQENITDVSMYGVEVNRAFGAGDTIVYIPLIALSIIGLILRKRWSLITTAAVMGVSAYWATTIVFMLIFLPGTPGYSLQPDMEYWLFIAAFIIFGVCGLLYLVYRGEKLLA